jgi:hypothetical protein
MKIAVFIFSTVFIGAQAFAAQEEVLFSCKGGKTSDGETPIYKVESLRNGRWVSTVEAEGVISEGQESSDLITISNQTKKSDGCVLTLDQKITGKAHTLSLVYTDKELTLKDKVAPNFANAPCKVISKALRKQLNECEIKDREQVAQGLLCRSDKVDDTEIHVRVDVNKEVSYAERTVYQYYQGKAAKLGTRAAEITSSLIKDGNECIVTVTEAKETSDKMMRLVIRLKKPFTDASLGRVETSKITAKSSDGRNETITMPDSFKNMKCEFMGDLSSKISQCKVDTIASSEEAAPPKTKKPSSPSPTSPATQQNTRQ